MNKVLLATLLTFVGLAVVSDAFAFGNCGGRRRCATTRSCEKQCAPVPTITRKEEKPCGPAPCCLTAVQVPANLVQHIEYSWECPTGCTVQSGEGY